MILLTPCLGFIDIKKKKTKEASTKINTQMLELVDTQNELTKSLHNNT